MIYVIYFLSGLTALTYEVVWGRYLMLVTGMTTAAISIHLATFMGGLATGSWWAGKRAGAQPQPQRVYAVLECGIGIYALLLPSLFRLVRVWYDPLLEVLGDQGLLLQSLRVLATLFLIFVPSVLIGATFPVVSRWATGLLRHRSARGARITLLYAVNTLGGSAACLLAAFWAIPALGLSKTLWITAAINFVLAGVSWFMPGQQTASRQKPEPRPDRQPPRWIPWFAFWTGLTALAAEVLFTRVLLFTLTATIHSFAAMLSAFLLGIGAGSLVLARLQRGIISRGKRERSADPQPEILAARRFAQIQLLLGMAILALSPVWPRLIFLAQELAQFTGDATGSTLMAKLLLSIAVLFVPAFFMGLSFPLLIAVQMGAGTEVSWAVGRVYALNTAGSLLGPLAAAFVLIPLAGIQGSLLLLAALTCVFALGLMFHLTPRRAWSWGAAVLVLAAAISVPSQWSVKNALDGDFMTAAGQKLLDYQEGPTSTVAVIEYEPAGYRELKIDGFPSAGTTPDYGYMRMMGHLPLLLHPRPEKALVICFGTGTTAGAASLHGLNQLDIVDLDRTVFRMSHWFQSVNFSVLEKPFTRTFVEDGRAFVQASPSATYDMVTAEPLPPYFAGMANLYSLEYYQQVRRILRPRGIVCQWLPFHLLDPQENLTLVKTFTTVFPRSQLWVVNYTGLLVGSAEGVSVQYPRIRERIQRGPIAASLAEVNLDRPETLLDSYLLDEIGLSRLLGHMSAPVLTDDAPLIEFVRPRPLFRRRQAAGSWAAPMVAQVYEIRKQLPPDIEGLDPAHWNRVDQYRRFSNYVNIGKMLVTLDLHAEAEEQFQAGLQAVSSPALRADLFLQLGIVRARSGNWLGAEEAFTEGLDEATGPSLRNLLLLNRARTRIQRSDFAGARADLETALAGDPQNSAAWDLMRRLP